MNIYFIRPIKIISIASIFLLLFSYGTESINLWIFEGREVGISESAALSDSKFGFQQIDPSNVILKRAGVVVNENVGSDEPGSYIIQLVSPPLASYRGEINGLEPTSPSVTGARKLDVQSEVSLGYLSYLTQKQNDLLALISDRIDREIEPQYRYQIAFNGLALRLTPQEAAEVARLPSVKQVQRNFLRFPLTDAGPRWIGAEGIWDGSQTGGLGSTKGEGVIIGIIDTGINMDHPSFSDVGGDDYDHINPYGSGNYVGWCDPGNPNYNSTWICNDKLIGVWSYPESGADPEDDIGHGSHTASIAAGNVITDATLITSTTTFIAAITGVAPHANIVSYDTCMPSGCSLTALVAAINQAVADGVDVINYSIGGGSNNPWVDSDAIAFLGARNAGLFVATSAGNTGPDGKTINSPADAPWVMAVGASTHNRRFVNSIADMSGGLVAPVDIYGTSITSGYGPAPIVYAGDYGDALCLGTFPIDTWNGEIVVCDRGGIDRVVKGANVLAGGAGGLILANLIADSDSLIADPHVLPSVHITYTDGQILKEWLSSGTDHQATITGSFSSMDPAYGDVMASFSSRGPNPSVPDVIKPDIVAPGLDIFAAYKDPMNYNLLSGTSMSSPHVAGAAALLTALHPSWSPGEIHSVLMTTATTKNLVKEDQNTVADSFDMGAGRVNLSAAAISALVLDETMANFLLANPASGGDPSDLNLPSLAQSNCIQVCSWKRLVKDALEIESNWSVSVQTPVEMELEVSPATFSIQPGSTQNLVINADVSDLPIGQWVFANVILSEDDGLAPDIHFPVAVRSSVGTIPPMMEINTRRNSGSQLLEDLTTKPISDLMIRTYGLNLGTSTIETLSQDLTNGDPYDNLNDGTTFFVTKTVPMDAVRFVAEIVSSTAPDMDLYVGLDVDDGRPDADEEICGSATASSRESCDITNPLPGTYWILVQNYQQSNSPPDTVELVTAVVPDLDNGNMTVDGPTSIAAGIEYDLRVYWDTPDMIFGHRWYGAFDIGSNLSKPGDIGFVSVNLIRHEDDVTKEVDNLTPNIGDVLTYELTVRPNVTGTTHAYDITDTIPEGLTYVPGSVTGNASFVENIIKWTGVMPGTGYYTMTTSHIVSNCRVPLSELDGSVDAYTDLASFGINPLSNIFGDHVWYLVNTSGVPNTITFYGRDIGNTLHLTDDGFAFFPPSTPGATPWINMDIPDSSDPNNLLAALWHDFEIVYDGSANRGVTFADITDNGFPVAHLIEYDDVEPFPINSTSDRFDFEIYLRRGVDHAIGTYEIILAFDNLNGNLSTGTVGIENDSGTFGIKYAYDDQELSTINNGMAICFDWVLPDMPKVITYQVTVDPNPPSKILTNTVFHDTDNPGSLPDTSSVDVSLVDVLHTFADVQPSHWAYHWIEALAEANITAGCSIDPPLFCPDDPVTRAQMAIFLERGMRGSEYNPPPATGEIFDDVSVNHAAAGWIEQLASDEITDGCSVNPLLYCPESFVTRAQASLFLERAMHWPDPFTPPSATGMEFQDVPLSHWAAAWIEQLANDGIAVGCSLDPPLYCPERFVTRAEMAVFLVRTFDLLVP